MTKIDKITIIVAAGATVCFLAWFIWAINQPVPLVEKEQAQLNSWRSF